MNWQFPCRLVFNFLFYFSLWFARSYLLILIHATYRKVASSRLGYYSILVPFGQYVTAHKQVWSLKILGYGSNRKCSCSQVYSRSKKLHWLWGRLACIIMNMPNKMSRNKSSFSWYLPLFWPVPQSRAAVEPNLSLSQNTPISSFVNQVMAFKLYLVNTTHRTLLYALSQVRIVRTL